MEQFRTIASVVAPLPLNDVDTDLLIPAQYLTSISRNGYGENLFHRLRDNDKNFFMNQPRYKDSKILVSGENFGCGSSREHAVWALLGAGFRVVIAKSFADIFAGNSAKNGLLLITLPAKMVEELLTLAERDKSQITVDLASQRISLPDNSIVEFQYDSYRKHCLLKGLDDLDYLVSHQDKIGTHGVKHHQNVFLKSGFGV